MFFDNQLKKAKASFIHLGEFNECGPICLQAISRFYKKDPILTQLIEWCGTDNNGTTLLGLKNAAEKLGYNFEALRANGIHSLGEASKPGILHVVSNKNAYHYVVYYGRDKSQKHIIGDPIYGVKILTESELQEIWVSKIFVELTPNSIPDIQFLSNREKVALVTDLFKEEWSIFAVSVLLGVTITSIGIISTFFYKKLIDNLIPNKDISQLMFFGIFFGILLTISLFLTYLRNVIIFRHSRIINLRLFEKLLFTIGKLPKSFFDRRSLGEFTSRLIDIRTIDVFISQVLSNSLISLIQVLIFTTTLFFISVKIGLAVSAMVIICLILSQYFVKEISSKQRITLVSYSETENSFIELIKGIEPIKSFRVESIFTNHINTIFSKYQSTTLNLNLLESRFSLVVGFVSILSTITVIIISSLEVMSNSLSIGMVLSILFLSSTAVSSALGFTPIILIYQKVKVSINRIFDILLLEPKEEAERISSISDFENIQLRNVSFGFLGKKTFINELELVIKKCDLISITGEVGSGKSILLSIINGIYEPTHGTIVIKVNDEIISKDSISSIEWRKLFATVHQEVVIFSGSLLQNITLSNNPNQDDINRALSLYQFLLSSQFKNQPDGPLTLVGQGGVRLSGGQTKLIGLARALFSRPKVLLLDELTSGMDPETELVTSTVLNTISKSITIISVHHKPMINMISTVEYELIDNKLSKRNNA